ncbi:uncharacterized protein ACRADG_007141 isoform 2-T2 [Cochliomyia hominivorax]
MYKAEKPFVFKLEKILPKRKSTPADSEEWGSGWKGTNFIVEIEETASVSSINSDFINRLEDISSTVTINTTKMVIQGPKIIVRTEEILIVGIVLMLWIGAIILFFNRWGKIRMLEPYQPKFQQQHRASCPLSDIDSIPLQRSSVSRMSMGFVNNVNMPSCQFAAYNPGLYSKAHSRPRQNSVFVGSSPNQYLMPRPPRKTRSAMDLHSIILGESAEQV